MALSVHLLPIRANRMLTNTHTHICTAYMFLRRHICWHLRAPLCAQALLSMSIFICISAVDMWIAATKHTHTQTQTLVLKFIYAHISACQPVCVS